MNISNIRNIIVFGALLPLACASSRTGGAEGFTTIPESVPEAFALALNANAGRSVRADIEMQFIPPCSEPRHADGTFVQSKEGRVRVEVTAANANPPVGYTVTLLNDGKNVWLTTKSPAVGPSLTIGGKVSEWRKVTKNYDGRALLGIGWESSEKQLKDLAKRYNFNRREKNCNINDRECWVLSGAALPVTKYNESVQAPVTEFLTGRVLVYFQRSDNTLVGVEYVDGDSKDVPKYFLKNVQVDPTVDESLFTIAAGTKVHSFKEMESGDLEADIK